MTAISSAPTWADRSLDLSRKASRLLAESSALVVAHYDNVADIENLG